MRSSSVTLTPWWVFVVCGTTWFMNVSDGMYLLTTSASVGGASGDALLLLLAPFVISASSQASPAYAKFSTAPVQSMSHVFLSVHRPVVRRLELVQTAEVHQQMRREHHQPRPSGAIRRRSGDPT